MFHTRNAVLALTALVALGLPTLPAAAQTYSFQVDSGHGLNYTGPGAAGSDNFIRTTYQGNTDTIGNLSYLYSATEDGVTLTYDANNSNFSSSATDPSTPQALLGGFDMAQSGGNGHIEAMGFTPGATITAYFYGTNGDFSGQAPGTRNTTFTLTDATFTTLGVSGTVTELQDTSFSNPGNYVTLTGTADSSGNFYATYKGTLQDEGDFNGVQFVVAAAPEPSQFAGLGLGLLGLSGLILKARRRSA